jgi:hypothetical protein
LLLLVPEALGFHAITWHSTLSRPATTVRTQHENSKQYISRCAMQIQADQQQRVTQNRCSRLHGAVMLTLLPGAAAPSFAPAPSVRTATMLSG